MSRNKMKRYSWVMVIPFLWIGFYAVDAKTDPGLKFIQNKNQWPAAVDFSARIPGGRMYVQPGQFNYILVDEKKLEEIHERTHTKRNESDGKIDPAESINKHLLQVNFIGANPNAVPQPFGQLSTYYNYFTGTDTRRWASRANSYSGIFYANFYAGINLKIYSLNENLKYDYIVAPGADPAQIAVHYSGAEELYLDNGNLRIKTSLGEMIEKRPYAFQFVNGKKIEIACEYSLEGNTLSFCFPHGFDPCYELTIDPLLIFSTFSGSTADNWGSTATPGEKGNLYSAGVTNELNFGGKFPRTAGAFQTTYGGMYDIGILKYDSAGKQLLYATYLGGQQSESPHSLVMNASEELIVLGTTSSTDFPTTTDAISRTFSGGEPVSHVLNFNLGSDIFIARISKDGSQLLSSTYIGGSSNDGLNPQNSGLVRNYGDELRGDVITDAIGNIYVSSVTSSSDFPLTNGFDTGYNGGLTDAIVLKLNPSLTEIIWGTFLGGSGEDASHTLKLDHDGNVFLAGGTNSSNFPVTSGSYQTTLAGLEDGWIVKIQNDGQAILNATFTGTANYDQVYFLDLNQADEVYVYGQTNGNFPIHPTTVYKEINSGQFLQKFDNALSATLFSTVFGSHRGFPDISPTAFLVNDCNNIYMSGWGGLINSASGFWQSSTQGLRVSSDAIQETTSGSDFYFIVLTDDATEFLYGTYLGGQQSRTHVDGGTSRFDKGGIVYHAVCAGCDALNASGHSTSDFPTTSNAWSNLNRSQNCNNAAFKFDLSSLKARIQTNSVAMDMPGLSTICWPDKIVFENKCIGGETFEWDFGDGTPHEFTTNKSPVTHQYAEEGKTYTVKLKAIDNGTCIGEDITQTTIHVFIRQTEIQDDNTICDGTGTTLTSVGSAFYDWTSDDGSFQSHDSQNVHAIEPKDTTIYYVTITEAGGCIRKDTVQINVIPAMKLDFKLNYVADCFSRPRINLINLSTLESKDKIFFDFGDGETSEGDDIEHAYANDGTYHVKIVGSREFCVFEKPLDASAYMIKVPNVITPGAEGSNDAFTIQYGDVKGVTPSDHNIKVSLLIYNRWGRLVYESNDYKYDWYAQGLAAGVYYYDLTIQGYTTCKSWLHVIK